jgi:5-methylthioribose kinase
MREIDSDTAADYLRHTGRVSATEEVAVRELSGGISNLVLLLTLPARSYSFVVKQARERLRVKDDWRCSPERIWREVAVLKICGEVLAAQRSEVEGPSEHCFTAIVPGILWEDRENYVYAMTAAPQDHKTWKEMLLAGQVEQSREIAVTCGRLLGSLHAASWNDEHIARKLDDRSYFDQLRLDPYYRRVAAVHADLAPRIHKLIESVWQHRCCLVHGDFSPKNLLVWPDHVMLIDFEVGHYGDPAFDLGFFQTHLILKSLWSGPRQSEYLQLADDFWQAYHSTLASCIPAAELFSLEQRLLLNLAGCMLARVDGKSPVDYLTVARQAVVRQLARSWITQPPASWSDLLQVLRTEY